MANKQIQLEIFEQGQKIKKGLRIPLEISEQPNEPKFPTHLCIKVACLLIITIVSFALGVERGKRVSKKEISTPFLANDKTQEVTQELTMDNKKIELSTPNKKLEPSKKLEKEEKDDKISTSGYIIQVVTYKKDSSYVEKEIAKLKKNGYNALAIAKGNYMEICVGEFTNKKEAQENLQKLKTTYKDCLIKKI